MAGEFTIIHLIAVLHDDQGDDTDFVLENYILKGMHVFDNKKIPVIRV